MSDKAFIYGLIGGALWSYLTRSKQQQVQQPVQQQVQQQLTRMPHEFDYVIDIYNNSIEITDQNGAKTNLNTIDDLNNWLSSITNKNILIWNHGNMTGVLKLTSNTYVVNGRPTRFETLLTQQNIDLFYLTPSVRYKEEGYIMYAIRNAIFESTWTPRPGWTPIPVSNINIFAIGTVVEIWSNPYETNQVYDNIHITAIDSPYVYASGIRGGVIASGETVQVEKSELVDGLFARSTNLMLYDNVISNYLIVESRNSDISGNTYQVDSPIIDIQGTTMIVSVGSNSSRTGALHFDMDFGESYLLEITNIYEMTRLEYEYPDKGSWSTYLLTPLSRNEVDVQVDMVNKTVTVTNKTDRGMDIVVTYRYRNFYNYF